MLDWSDSPPGVLDPTAKVSPGLWDRLTRAFASVPDRALIKGFALAGAAGGDLVPHGVRGRLPKAAFVQVVGDVSATVRVGAIDSVYLRLHASAACTVDIRVEI